MSEATPEELEHFRDLCTMVGALFITWARLESEMAATLRHFLTYRMRDKHKGLVISSAIYGSMRMKASRDTMKRLATELRYGPKLAGFHEAFFTQIGHIEDLRDKIAHNVVKSADEKLDGHWTVSDLATTRTISKYKTYEFESEALVAATTDLKHAASAELANTSTRALSALLSFLHGSINHRC